MKGLANAEDRVLYLIPSLSHYLLWFYKLLMLPGKNDGIIFMQFLCYLSLVHLHQLQLAFDFETILQYILYISGFNILFFFIPILCHSA